MILKMMDCILFKPTTRGFIQTEENLNVVLAKKFNRKKLSKETEDDINVIWKSKAEKNSHLWNGTKFRLHKILQVGDALIKLELGVTDYKDFMGTNYSDRSSELQSAGRRECGDAGVYLAHPLGVGGVVVSKDEKIILILRSEVCGEATGLYDVPGGHPEPKEIFGNLTKNEISDILSDADPTKVVGELFNSIRCEVRDEINIPMEKLGESIFMGIAGNKYSADRPTAEFYIRCDLESEEIRHLYSSGTQKEAEESTKILFYSVNKLPGIKSDQIWNRLTESAKAAILLYVWHSKY